MPSVNLTQLWWGHLPPSIRRKCELRPTLRLILGLAAGITAIATANHYLGPGSMLPPFIGAIVTLAVLAPLVRRKDRN